MFSEKEIFNLSPSQLILDLQQNVVDNLDPKQKDKIIELRSRLDDLLKPIHTDFFLLKWLKAKKFDVVAAENMLRANFKWRKEWRVDYIHEEFEPHEVMLKYFPFVSGGEDKDGSPILIIASGNFDIPGAMYSVQKSDFIRFHIFIFEYFERKIIQMSEKHKKLVSGVVIISDVENINNLNLLKQGLSIYGEIQYQMFEPNYPDFGKNIYAINVSKALQIFFRIARIFMNEDIKTKFGIFGKTGWKEAFLEIIDAEQLPKHWGGKLDDDAVGNPYGKIIMGGPIPKSYYKTMKIDEGKINNVVIPNRGKMTAEIEITFLDSVISWDFQTENYDIGFALTLKRPNDEQSNNSEVVIPWGRANSHLAPQDGKWKCQETGTYIVTFDNSYSWYKSKKLAYCIQVSTPNSAIADIILQNTIN